MRRSLLAAAVAVPALLAARPAAAHLGLIDPPSRYGQDVLKDGPCGQFRGLRSTNVVTAEAGSTLTIQWSEYVDHPGHFRIAFDDDGDNDFRDPRCLTNCESGPGAPTFETDMDPTVLYDMIPDTRGTVTTFDVVLPDVECANCTLQVIQVMYDKRPYVSGGDDIYYQCIDLVLTREPPDPDAGTMMDDAGGGADAGRNDAGGGARDSGRSDSGRTDGGPGGGGGGGCSAAGGAAGGTRPRLALLSIRRARRRWRR